MFEDAELYFPNNVVKMVHDFIVERGGSSDPEGLHVFMRPLRKTDPKLSVGVFASLWFPDEQSYEIGGATLGGMRQEPTLQQYVMSIQGLVVDGDEERGLAKSSAMAKMLRDMFLRDPHVGVALSGLSIVGADGLTERVKRRWIRTQRYISNEVQGSWTYLSSLELTIETETT